MTLDLAALEALIAKATPGPWYGVGDWVEHADDNVPDICTCDPDAMGQSHLARIYDKSGTRPLNNAALIAAACNALPDLIARVRGLERERQNYRAMRDDGGSTHWDIAEVGAICHPECAVTQLRDVGRTAALAMRERCAQACETDDGKRTWTKEARDAADYCAAAIRALEP